MGFNSIGKTNYLENVTLNGSGHSALACTTNGGGTIIVTGTFSATGSSTYGAVDVDGNGTLGCSIFDFHAVSYTDVVKAPTGFLVSPGVKGVKTSDGGQAIGLNGETW